MRRKPPAITFMATMPLPAWAASSMTSFMNGSIVKLYGVRITSMFGFVASQGISSFWPLCVLTPAKRILPAFLAICCASIRSSVTSAGESLRMQVPDVDEVGAEFLEAGVEMGEGFLLGAAPGSWWRARYPCASLLSAAPTMRSLLPHW